MSNQITGVKKAGEKKASYLLSPATTLHCYYHIQGLILCSKKKILAVESSDFSQAEKEITSCKADQIHKMTPIFTQNDIKGPF